MLCGSVLLAGCGITKTIERASYPLGEEAAYLAGHPPVTGIALGEWKESTMKSDTDGKPHKVEIRIKDVEKDPEKVNKEIEEYNLSGAANPIPPLDDDGYRYLIAHYEVYFPENYPQDAYGVMNVVPDFKITSSSGDAVIRKGKKEYEGLEETVELGRQPQGYMFYAPVTYEGSCLFLMATDYDDYRIKETAPDGTVNYYMPE